MNNKFRPLTSHIAQVRHAGWSCVQSTRKFGVVAGQPSPAEGRVIDAIN